MVITNELKENARGGSEEVWHCNTPQITFTPEWGLVAETLGYNHASRKRSGIVICRTLCRLRLAVFTSDGVHGLQSQVDMADLMLI